MIGCRSIAMWCVWLSGVAADMSNFKLYLAHACCTGLDSVLPLVYCLCRVMRFPLIEEEPRITQCRQYNQKFGGKTECPSRQITQPYSHEPRPLPSLPTQQQRVEQQHTDVAVSTEADQTLSRHNMHACTEAKQRGYTQTARMQARTSRAASALRPTGPTATDRLPPTPTCTAPQNAFTCDPHKKHGH